MTRESKLRINEEIRCKLAQTPAGECWLCWKLSELVKVDENGYYISLSDLDPGDYGHLVQVIESIKEE
jgi:hypothetical protein